MKSRILTVLIVLVVIGLLVGCGAASKLGVKKTAETTATEARVEILESKVKKITWYSSFSEKDMYGIEISGMAKYIPAEVDAEPFAKASLGKQLYFSVYNAAGKKLPVAVEVERKVCGEYGDPENVVANEPFPFTRKVSIDGQTDAEIKAIWDSISSHKFDGWR